MSYKKYENLQMNILSTTIKNLRKKNNWSQQDLSNKLELTGVYLSRSDISLIELNQRGIRDFEIIAFCYVFNITLDQLYKNSSLYKLYKNN